MDKLKMQTANKADENFKKLAEMFPNAVTEAIDENGATVEKEYVKGRKNPVHVNGNSPAHGEATSPGLQIQRYLQVGIYSLSRNFGAV